MKTSTSDLAGPLLSLSVTLALGLAACASAPSDPSDPSPSGGADAVRSSATSVALSVAAIRPVPYCPAQARACFPGGSVELVVADALAECGANSLVVEVADADLVDVYLTTVRQPMAQMIEQAITMLLARIAQRDRPTESICFPNGMVIRRSTARNGRTPAGCCARCWCVMASRPRFRFWRGQCRASRTCSAGMFAT